MIDRLFADTNILIYPLDPNEPEKRARAAAILRVCTEHASLVTSLQTLNECYRVLVERRRIIPTADARDYISGLAWSCTAPLDLETMLKAWEISDSRSYGWWDCVMLASAIQASSTVFLTEDLDDGDLINGMRILNPFSSERDLLPLRH
jgi:predicted nucleic acid-binding protein